MNNNKNENMNVTEKQRVYKEGDLELISAYFRDCFKFCVNTKN